MGLEGLGRPASSALVILFPKMALDIILRLQMQFKATIEVFSDLLSKQILLFIEKSIKWIKLTEKKIIFLSIFVRDQNGIQILNRLFFYR